MDTRPFVLAALLCFLTGGYTMEYQEDWTRYRVAGVAMVVREERCEVGYNQDNWGEDECYSTEEFGFDGYGRTCEEALAVVHEACVQASGKRCVYVGSCVPHYGKEDG